jgi:subtilisin family serine protease
MSAHIFIRISWLKHHCHFSDTPTVMLSLIVLMAAQSNAADTYLVMLNDGTDLATHLSALSIDYPTVLVSRNYSIGSFSAYALQIADTEASSTLNLLSSRADVKIIEKDIRLRLKSSSESIAKPVCDTQTQVPSWGLARASSTKLPLKGTYVYNDGVGANVDLYVMDTGVRVTHKEFEGRASFGYNAAQGKVDTDKDGHGTFVAGVAAAKTYGVCKECKVVSVKVFKDNGDCSASILIAGFDWVAKNFDKSGKRKSVINVSVGGDPGETSDAMDAAVNALVALGVHVVGAAGNEVSSHGCKCSQCRLLQLQALPGLR